MRRLIARLPDAKRQAEEYAASGMYQVRLRMACGCPRLPSGHDVPDVSMLAQADVSWLPLTVILIGLACLLLPQEAAETAAQARDGDMLSKIQAMVGAASPLGLAVSQIKGRLQIPLRP